MRLILNHYRKTRSLKGGSLMHYEGRALLSSPWWTLQHHQHQAYCSDVSPQKFFKDMLVFARHIQGNRCRCLSVFASPLKIFVFAGNVQLFSLVKTYTEHPVLFPTVLSSLLRCIYIRGLLIAFLTFIWLWSVIFVFRSSGTSQRCAVLSTKIPILKTTMNVSQCTV